MNLIHPPMFAVIIDKESGKEIAGHLVASRDYPFKVPNQRGELCFAKQFQFKPSDGGPAFWTSPFPVKSPVMKSSLN